MMKVYIDLVFLINFYLDFLIIIITSITLKKNAKLKRILLGSLVGSLSLIFLFININNYLLFFIKFIIAVLINIVVFGYKDLKSTLENISYFYMISIILGGFCYYLNIELNGFNNKTYFLLIISPIILYIYYRQTIFFKNTRSLIHKVKIVFNDQVLDLNGYIDTGNKLYDPVTKKGVIIINKKLVNLNDKKILYVPYYSVNNKGIIKCLKPQYIEIDGIKKNNYLVGLSDKKFNIMGVECLLHKDNWRDLND